MAREDGAAIVRHRSAATVVAGALPFIHSAPSHRRLRRREASLSVCAARARGYTERSIYFYCADKILISRNARIGAWPMITRLPACPTCTGTPGSLSAKVRAETATLGQRAAAANTVRCAVGTTPSERSNAGTIGGAVPNQQRGGDRLS